MIKNKKKNWVHFPTLIKSAKETKFGLEKLTALCLGELGFEAVTHDGYAFILRPTDPILSEKFAKFLQNECLKSGYMDHTPDISIGVAKSDDIDLKLLA